MDDGHRSGAARSASPERLGRSTELLDTLTALACARLEAVSAWALGAESLVQRLRRGLDEADALGLPAHLTQSALIWRSIARDLGIGLHPEVDRTATVPRGAAGPLARVAHELITNCFERAISRDRGGWICVGLSRGGDGIAAFTIHDHAEGQGRMRRSGGRPFPGARIVRHLAENAGADLSLLPTACGGTTVRLRFPSRS